MSTPSPWGLRGRTVQHGGGEDNAAAAGRSNCFSRLGRAECVFLSWATPRLEVNRKRTSQSMRGDIGQLRTLKNLENEVQLHKVHQFLS